MAVKTPKSLGAFRYLPLTSLFTYTLLTLHSALFLATHVYTACSCSLSCCFLDNDNSPHTKLVQQLNF